MDLLKENSLKLINDKVNDSGLKKTYIADQIGITQGYLSSILSGKKKLTLNVAVKISKVLSLPDTFFLK